MAKKTIDRTGVDLIDFSPSRLATASRCGLAFEYQYVRHLPAPFERASGLFGDAIHDGVLEWYGPDDKPVDHTERDLAPLVLAQWAKLLPPGIWNRVQELRNIDEECAAVAAAVSFKRPELKNPTQTVEYQRASAVKLFNEKLSQIVELCDAFQEIKWPKDENPYRAYKKSAVLAQQMQKRWQKLPRPRAVERPFRVDFEGFHLRGRIDQFRVDPARETGEMFALLLDIKTGRQLMSAMEAFIQAFLYWLACQQFDDLPNTDEFAFYMARKDQFQRGRIDPKRHPQLASRVLNGRARQIILQQFEPSYGFWCDRCDFKDLCTQEISMWDGEDGVYAEISEIAA